LHPDVRLNASAHGDLGSAHKFSDKFAAGKQRFPAVQDKRHALHLMAVRVLTDAHRGKSGDLD
jgi:hypothetical protein